MPWARDGSKMHSFTSSLGGSVEKIRKAISTAERLAFSIIISCFYLFVFVWKIPHVSLLSFPHRDSP